MRASRHRLDRLELESHSADHVAVTALRRYFLHMRASRHRLDRLSWRSLRRSRRRDRSSALLSACEPRATASTGSSWRSLRRSHRRDRSSALLSAHASLAPPPRQARAGGHSADHVAVTALRRYFLHMRASRHRLDRLELEVTPQITSPSRRRDRSSALLSAHASLAPPPRQARAGGHSADHVAVTALRRYFLHMRASRHRLDRLELESLRDHVAVTALRRYFLHMRASRHRLDRLELEVTPQITSP
ncbi:hypothetical protein J6590_020313 [Homalodisca vitripennis]|nr:hypothetical protein J6590_020313 [Homalodisca vitripennis]